MMGMAMASRLDNFDREVAVALRSAPPEVQHRVAEFAADWAVARTGLADPALLAESPDEVASAATELDERYFAVSGDRDAGRASTEDVVTAFGRARAASAVEFTRRGEAAEAVYEAAAALEDWSELRASVLWQLRSSGPSESGTAPARPRG
jgi:hypothetical protein